MKIASKTCIQPISCIAYPKDEETLIHSLECLLKKYPYIEYAYIFHYGEGEDKNHYHLLLRSTNIKGFKNTLELFNFFTQPCESDIFVKDSDGNDVLKYSKGQEVCYIAKRQFIVTNSLGDWYDYVLHDEDYLKNKD